jgi:hypothetical protein
MRTGLKSTPDYYAILGASENASAREIERLYKRAAHQRHPDRGGAEEDMKVLNEAYRVLHDQEARKKYDSERLRPVVNAAIHSQPVARDIGISGQLISALLCLALGLMLLFLVHFKGLWFLWPLSILAGGVVLFGVLIAHAAMTNARDSLVEAHPIRRLRALHEIVFWLVVGVGVYAVYLILTTI